MTNKVFHTAMKSALLIVVIFCGHVNSFGQKNRFRSDSVHSARKATIYSAVLPGLGQYYNEKSWKIPIVYAAIGGCLTAAIINNREYNVARDELLFRNLNGTRNSNDFLFYEDFQLLELSNYHRKWRDNMYIFTAVAYMLNIIDANVDGHLFNFNVDKDLTMDVSPFTFSQEINKPVAGLSFRLRFR